MAETGVSISKTFKVKIGPGKIVNEDLDEKGNIQLSRLALFHQRARLAGLRISLAEHHDPFFKTDTLFVRYQKTIVNKNITNGLVSHPIHALYIITYMGTSSVICKTHIILEQQQKCISTCYAQCVCVNRKSRRPAPFPKAFKDIYSYAAVGPKPQIAPLLPTPSDTNTKIYTKKYRIGKSDVDENGHTNNTVYIKLCSDVVRSSITNEMLSHFTQKILECNLKEYIIHYVGETKEGDDVIFAMWPDINNKYLLHFEAKKSDNVIVRCQFDFNKNWISSL